MRTLVLASQSPRRKELLEKAGFEFLISSLNISESLEENLTLEDALMSLARRKAKAVIESGKISKVQDYLVLAADTVVVLNQEILGKPESPTQAQDFLRRLSGRSHEVMTSICLWDGPTGEVITAIDKTKVEFRELKEQEIKKYIESGEPMDKAGAYAIQGGAASFVTKIAGDHDNVVGLPVKLFERLLKKNGWNIRRRKT